MKTIIPILSLCALCGCYSLPLHYELNNPGGPIQVVELPQWAAERTCRSIAAARGQKSYLSDEGKFIPEGGVNACADQVNRVIYMRGELDREEHDRVVAHEVAHIEAYDRRQR